MLVVDCRLAFCWMGKGNSRRPSDAYGYVGFRTLCEMLRRSVQWILRRLAVAVLQSVSDTVVRFLSAVVVRRYYSGTLLEEAHSPDSNSLCHRALLLATLRHKRTDDLEVGIRQENVRHGRLFVAKMCRRVNYSSGKCGIIATKVTDT